MYMKFISNPISCVARIFSVSLSAATIISVAEGCSAQTLPLSEVTDGVFVFRGGYETMTSDNVGLVSNLGFIVGTHAVAVIDTGGSRKAGERLLAAVRSKTSLPVHYVVNTHMHPDHVFGNAAFAGTGAIFVGHRRLKPALAARGGHYLQRNAPLLGDALIGNIEIIPPQMEVSGTMELDLGNRRLVLEAHATAHTDNDLTVFDVKSRTLFAGDLVFSRHIPALDGSITGWLDVMDELAAVPAERVVPGHGPASLPWPSGMSDQRRYLKAVAGDVRQFIRAGRTMDAAMEEAARGEAGNWLLFDEFHARNVAAAFAELEWE